MPCSCPQHAGQRLLTGLCRTHCAGPAGERISTASAGPPSSINLAAIANTPPPTPAALHGSRDSFSGSLLNTSAHGSANGESTKPKIPFGTFVLDVLRLHDLYGVLTYKADLYRDIPSTDDAGELR
jgi:hypothetical protein